MSLLLPWEVVGGVVGHACDDIDLLRSFSLTCRQLRPCSLRHMINRAHLKNRAQVSAFCDFLHTRIGLRLRPHIRSLIISPTSDVPHVPSLILLPNLSTLVFSPPISEEYHDQTLLPTVYLHTPTLFCYRQYGKGIRRLELAHLSFSTFPGFFRFIGAFPKMLHIVCRDIRIQRVATQEQHSIVRNALFKAVKPETITVRLTSKLPQSSANRQCSLSDRLWRGPACGRVAP